MISLLAGRGAQLENQQVECQQMTLNDESQHTLQTRALVILQDAKSDKKADRNHFDFIFEDVFTFL